jgi:chromosome segregation ATPase
MSKSRKHRKQKTSVKKKKKRIAQRKRISEPLLESTTKKKTPKAATVDGTVATLPAAPADKRGKKQPTVAKSAHELKMKRVGSGTKKSEIKMEGFADVLEERASIISIVKGLEEQVDAAFKLKDVLEAELDITQKMLSEELTARAQLEAQVKSLGEQSILADQLSEDISFIEEERNKFANLLAETQPQLEAVVEERDSIGKKATSVEKYAKKLEGEKTTLEARVMNLKDRVTDVNRLRGEVDNLRKELIDADSRVANLRIQLGEQRAANKGLIETRTRLESEMKIAKADHKTAEKEVNVVRKALHDVRGQAARSSGRVRQRCSKPKGKNKK